MKINQFPKLVDPTGNTLILVWDSKTNTTKYVKASSLTPLFGGGGSSDGYSQNQQFTYQSNGDNQGVFFFLGTNKGTEAWSNPTNKNVVVTASTVENGSPSMLVDRQTTNFWTNSIVSSWVRVKMKAKLKCSNYLLRNRTDPFYYLRSWIFQGSNDGDFWDDLDVRVGDTTINNPSDWCLKPTTQNTSNYYSHFRLLQTGVNSSNTNHLCLGEIELYGDLLY